MAQISLSAAAADIATNASALAGTASDITEAQYTALSQLLELLGQRKGDAIPLLHLLTDTNKAELKDGWWTISLPDIKLERYTLNLVGTSPLIVHAFPEKARKQMLDKQMKTAKGGRDARDPYAEVEAARYILPDGRDGIPGRWVQGVCRDGLHIIVGRD